MPILPNYGKLGFAVNDPFKVFQIDPQLSSLSSNESTVNTVLKQNWFQC